MGIFGKIRDVVFGRKGGSDASSPPPPTIDTTQAPGATPPAPAPPPSATAASPAIDRSRVVDVENTLDSMPGADHLNWRTSIVDLMKLVGIDADFESRKLLAQELGRPDYSGSAEDNVWLHRKVMQGLASNGGKIPPEFLD
ncbi:DUF3597 domain-containing protein [Tsuneonella suprasediminis]|uniref:DUF3597 domain-containing protein n=1 Tax=Tsuneonella suprasediminis TaxID=2306996 RepID=UPI002F92DE19